MTVFPRINPRTTLAMLHDIAAAAAAWVLAFWLRLNLELPPEYGDAAVRSLPVVVCLQALIFWRLGLYRGIWRYASLHDLRLIVLAVGAGALAAPFALLLLRLASPIPRSVFVLDPLLLLFMMGGSRLAFRAWKEGRVAGLSSMVGEPVIILGAGDAADALIRELSAKRDWRVVGLLDDGERKQGRQIHGIPVRGRIDDVGRVSKALDVSQAIIAMPEASHVVRRKAMSAASAAGLKVMTVPAFDDIVSGRVTVSQLRQVELDDLLGRDPVVLDSAGLSDLLSGKVVLVTGAGGSIGSELCRQIARFGPLRLVLFELSEYALYEVEQELHRAHPDQALVCIVGDARNRARVEQVLRQYRPEVLFHAAAYKHVPLMEEENAWEAMQNNALGTYALASACAAVGVQKFVLISTDKAVNPVNVMGASKRLAELVCLSLHSSEGTRFVIVRFGNVLGSAGSVIPKFRQQIASGGPVTVTHPEITRYFMSIPEAAQLVLQAGAMGKGGEIFVLDMGEPVRIVDLAREMIRLSGFAESDIGILFTGLRSGEKLYEEVLADDERTLPTPHPKLRMAVARPPAADLLPRLLAWLNRSDIPAADTVREELTRFVPEYSAAPSTSVGEKRAANE